MGALTIFVQGRDMLMPEKEVSLLVTNVTALPQRMVGVVMHNGGPNSAWHRHSRETALLVRFENRGIARQTRHLYDFDVVTNAYREGVDRIDRCKTHLLANSQRDPIGMRLKPPCEPHFYVPRNRE